MPALTASRNTRISDTYREGALLLHPSFGIGLVTKHYLASKDGSHIRKQQEIDGYEH